MEIGPLSEWVGALAELIAVAVALFLPYYNERKALHQRLRRYKHIVEQTLNTAAANQLTADYRDFCSFVKITLQLDMDDTAVEILEVGQALITTVGDATTLSFDQLQTVGELRQQLANINA
ncbi:hypothetical protein D1831_02075 [Lactiplantibacillus garii]|uniref:Uncharacterized protein n=1 Tax=Lactiplantibacillus garii TaxID=2306423 RepID=A0A426DAB4_9LACO|nr:hypothetical protein [Lactiplantibacillus garii]RRK11501.1 hypothetical protein D1831_02075 [Lactiplantibacillus garii]